jgi:hypothetical protein
MHAAKWYAQLHEAFNPLRLWLLATRFREAALI